MTCWHPQYHFFFSFRNISIFISLSFQTSRMDPTQQYQSELKCYPIEGRELDGSTRESSEVTASITATQAGIERLQEDITRSRADMTNLGKKDSFFFFFSFSVLLQEPSSFLLKALAYHHHHQDHHHHHQQQREYSSMFPALPPASPGYRQHQHHQDDPDTSESPIPAMLPLSMSFQSDHSCSSSTQPAFSSTSSSSNPSASSGSGGGTVPLTREQSQQRQLQSQERDLLQQQQHHEVREMHNEHRDSMRAMNQTHKAQQIGLDQHNATSGTLSSMLESDSGESARRRPPRFARTLGGRRQSTGTQNFSVAPLPPGWERGARHHNHHHSSHFHHHDEIEDQRRHAEGHTPEGGSTAKPARTCANCGTQDTVAWRRNRAGDLLCNPCGLYLQSNSKPRPKSVWDTGHKRRPKIIKAVAMKEAGPPTSSSSPEERTTPPPPPLPCNHKED